MILQRNIDCDDTCIPEEDYDRIMKDEVEPLLQGIVKKGWVECSDGELYYELFPCGHNRGTVVISHGFTEFIRKYYELIYYFYMEGYQVAIMEHRGHGNSLRQTLDEEVIHVNSFHDYVQDLYAFMDRVVLGFAKDKPLYLFAHSMGGGIAASFLEQYPGVFSRCVLTSPMMGVLLNGFPVLPVKIVCRSMVRMGKGDKRIFLRKIFTREKDFDKSAAQSMPRYERYASLRDKHRKYHTCIPSYGWVYAAIREKSSVLSKENCRKITIPLLLFQAENDTYVLSKPQRTFIGRIPKGKLMEVKGAKHELYQMENEGLEAYLREIFAFFAGKDSAWNTESPPNGK